MDTIEDTMTIIISHIALSLSENSIRYDAAYLERDDHDGAILFIDLYHIK